MSEITTKARMHLLAFAALLASVAAGPTLYNIDKEAGTAERVMVPVSSTVIPLSICRTYKGFQSRMLLKKPFFFERKPTSFLVSPSVMVIISFTVIPMSSA